MKKFLAKLAKAIFRQNPPLWHLWDFGTGNRGGGFIAGALMFVPLKYEILWPVWLLVAWIIFGGLLYIYFNEEIN